MTTDLMTISTLAKPEIRKVLLDQNFSGAQSPCWTVRVLARLPRPLAASSCQCCWWCALVEVEHLPGELDWAHRLDLHDVLARASTTAYRCGLVDLTATGEVCVVRWDAGDIFELVARGR